MDVPITRSINKQGVEPEAQVDGITRCRTIKHAIMQRLIIGENAPERSAEIGRAMNENKRMETFETEWASLNIFQKAEAITTSPMIVHQLLSAGLNRSKIVQAMSYDLPDKCIMVI